MNKRKWFAVGVFGVLLVGAAAAGYFWYQMGEPLYQPGTVRAGANLRAPLSPPPQGNDRQFWEVERGINLYHWSQGQGKDVLMVHGGPGLPYAQAWTGLDFLAARYRFDYYDQRGSGQSSRPIERFTSSNYYDNLITADRTLGVGAQVADIERIRRILGQDKLILIGHSWGGFLASLYAAEFPERVQALILVAPADMLVMPQPDGGLFETVKRRLPASRQADYAAFLQSYLGFNDIFGKSDTELVALNEEFGRYFEQAYARPLPEQGKSGGWMVWAQYLSLGTRHDYRAALRQVTAPVLVIHGAQDLQSEKASGTYVAAFPNARLHVISDAGHFPFYEAPEEFGAAVGNFLDELER